MKRCHLIGLGVALTTIHLPPGTAEEVPAGAPPRRAPASAADGEIDVTKLRYISSGVGATARTAMAKLSDFTSYSITAQTPKGPGTPPRPSRRPSTITLRSTFPPGPSG